MLKFHTKAQLHALSLHLMIRGLEHLSYEDRLRVGVVQPGQEKAAGRPCCGLPVPEGGLQESWRGTFYKGL